MPGFSTQVGESEEPDKRIPAIIWRARVLRELSKDGMRRIVFPMYLIFRPEVASVAGILYRRREHYKWSSKFLVELRSSKYRGMQQKNARIAIYQLRDLGVFSHGQWKSFVCTANTSREVGVRNAPHPMDRRDNWSNTVSRKNLFPARFWSNSNWSSQETQTTLQDTRAHLSTKNTHSQNSEA